MASALYDWRASVSRPCCSARRSLCWPSGKRLEPPTRSPAPGRVAYRRDLEVLVRSRCRTACVEEAELLETVEEPDGSASGLPVALEDQLRERLFLHLQVLVRVPRARSLEQREPDGRLLPRAPWRRDPEAACAGSRARSRDGIELATSCSVARWSGASRRPRREVAAEHDVMARLRDGRPSDGLGCCRRQNAAGSRLRPNYSGSEGNLSLESALNAAQTSGDAEDFLPRDRRSWMPGGGGRARFRSKGCEDDLLEI